MELTLYKGKFEGQINSDYACVTNWNREMQCVLSLFTMQDFRLHFLERCIYCGKCWLMLARWNAGDDSFYIKGTSWKKNPSWSLKRDSGRIKNRESRMVMNSETWVIGKACYYMAWWFRLLVFILYILSQEQRKAHRAAQILSPNFSKHKALKTPISINNYCWKWTVAGKTDVCYSEQVILFI